MARQARIKGGEKNVNSGKKWTREELNKVLSLYIRDRQLKIHESNENIKHFAKSIGRTTRSVEAQLLMFRALDKFGNYGYKNMNSICRELWKEFIDSTLPPKK
jgi:hypothetical protein